MNLKILVHFLFRPNANSVKLLQVPLTTDGWNGHRLQLENFWGTFSGSVLVCCKNSWKTRLAKKKGNTWFLVLGVPWGFCVRAKAFNHNFSKLLTKHEQNPRNTAPLLIIYCCVVVQFYPWFNFCFPQFYTHYHTLPYTKTDENKSWTKDKILKTTAVIWPDFLFDSFQLVCEFRCVDKMDILGPNICASIF